MTQRLRPRHGLAVALTLLIAACTTGELATPPPAPEPPPPPPPKARKLGYFRLGAPYQINGVRYVPRLDWNYDRTGRASWYGPRFHGRLTANGEIFDQHELTAAHQTLPLPSIVRVTNLDNGRTLVLRVNDRGPFVRGRILDVSGRAAHLLRFKDKGTARVRVQVLEKESREAAAEVGWKG